MCILRPQKVYSMANIHAYKLFVEYHENLWSTFYRDKDVMPYKTNKWLDFIPYNNFRGFHSFGTLEPIRNIIQHPNEWELVSHSLRCSYKYIVLPVVLSGEIYMGEFYDNYKYQIAYYSDKIWVCDSPIIRAKTKQSMEDRLWDN